MEQQSKYNGLLFSEDWLERTKIIASMIEVDGYPTSVADIGCGERRLKNFLPDGCHYSGFDLPEVDLDWSDEDWYKQTSGDFNPSELSPFDYIVLSGVLEYLYEPKRAIKRLNCKQLILSYCPFPSLFLNKNIPEVWESRFQNGWVNHFTTNSLSNILYESGFVVSEAKIWNDQIIWKCRNTKCN